MKKLIFLLVVPMVSFAQNDSLRLDENLQGKTGTEVKSPDLPKPLYFIDGKQTNEAVIKEINPDTIESINVLKGEKAIEKYGESGINGVIEINMKKQEVSVSEMLSAPMVCYAGIIENSIKENYDLAVLDLGYESFLAMQPAAATYSLNYLENKNNQYVSIWNQRVLSGNPEIYEMPIDYEVQTYYGLEFEYKLFMFFKFMEDKHKITML